MTYTRDLPSSIENRRKELRALWLDGVVFGKPVTYSGHKQISVGAESGGEIVNVVRVRNDRYRHDWHVEIRQTSKPDCQRCSKYGPCSLHEWESVWSGDDLTVAKAIAARELKGLPMPNENIRTRYHTLTPACVKGRIHDGDCEAFPMEAVA